MSWVISPSMLPDLDRKWIWACRFFREFPLTNADFTGLMQALQRPLQPTLHLSLQANLGGVPLFAPGISADLSNISEKAKTIGSRVDMSRLFGLPMWNNVSVASSVMKNSRCTTVRFDNNSGLRELHVQSAVHQGSYCENISRVHRA